MDQIHLPDPVKADIQKLQEENMWMMKKMEELEKRIELYEMME